MQTTLAGDEPRTDVRQHSNWGAVHPGDDRVRLTFTTERGAREYVARTPGARLVCGPVTVTTTTTFGDWQVVEERAKMLADLDAADADD